MLVKGRSPGIDVAYGHGIHCAVTETATAAAPSWYCTRKQPGGAASAPSVVGRTFACFHSSSCVVVSHTGGLPCANVTDALMSTGAHDRVARTFLTHSAIVSSSSSPADMFSADMSADMASVMSGRTRKKIWAPGGGGSCDPAESSADLASAAADSDSFRSSRLCWSRAATHRARAFFSTSSGQSVNRPVGFRVKSPCWNLAAHHASAPSAARVA